MIFELELIAVGKVTPYHWWWWLVVLGDLGVAQQLFAKIIHTGDIGIWLESEEKNPSKLLLIDFHYASEDTYRFISQFNYVSNVFFQFENWLSALFHCEIGYFDDFGRLVSIDNCIMNWATGNGGNGVSHSYIPIACLCEMKYSLYVPRLFQDSPSQIVCFQGIMKKEPDNHTCV
jgi:hypothetical protein